MIHYLDKHQLDRAGRPLIQLFVWNQPNGRISRNYPEVLVDTGANLILFPRDVADDLQRVGLQVTSKLPPGIKNKKITWRGEPKDLFFAKVDLELHDKAGYILRWPATVAFWDEPQFVFGIAEGLCLFKFGHDPSAPDFAVQPLDIFRKIGGRVTPSPN